MSALCCPDLENSFVEIRQVTAANRKLWTYCFLVKNTLNDSVVFEGISFIFCLVQLCSSAFKATFDLSLQINIFWFSRPEVAQCFKFPLDIWALFLLFDQVLKNLVVYVVECLPRAERCSDAASEHDYPSQCAQKMCIRGLIHWFGRAVLACYQWLSSNTFIQWHFSCHHCIPWPWKYRFWCTICHTFDILDHIIIMRYCVDVGHLGKWRRVWIAHTSDDVITQFRDPQRSWF